MNFECAEVIEKMIINTHDWLKQEYESIENQCGYDKEDDNWVCPGQGNLEELEDILVENFSHVYPDELIAHLVEEIRREEDYTLYVRKSDLDRYFTGNDYQTALKIEDILEDLKYKIEMTKQILAKLIQDEWKPQAIVMCLMYANSSFEFFLFAFASKINRQLSENDKKTEGQLRIFYNKLDELNSLFQDLKINITSKTNKDFEKYDEFRKKMNDCKHRAGVSDTENQLIIIENDVKNFCDLVQGLAEMLMRDNAKYFSKEKKPRDFSLKD